MTCNKQQLVQGVQSFINEDMVPNVQDKPLQMALYAIAQFPAVISGILDKPFMKMVLNESGGQYDLDQIRQALCSTMDRFGSFPITINPIPFILPSQVSINLTRTDVESLMRHIERMV